MSALSTIWRLHLARLAFAIVAIVALFYVDVFKMVEIWWTSSTFTHCLFILPLVGWLIWQRGDEVLAIEPRVWAPGLVLIAAAGTGWMIGQAAGVSILRHACIIMMIQGSVLTLLGPAVTRGLLFPLFYLYFLVPFGDELVPPLQTITAKLCMLFLGWAGIPAHIEGVFISTASGNFEVAEACSGVKFLVAMFAYSTLVANVCFRSWAKRAAFMALAVTVPVIANGVRAYATIHISYLTSNAFAEGIDHVVYGWFFFGFVMLLVMALAWKFFDRSVSDPWLSPSHSATLGFMKFGDVTPRRAGVVMAAAVGLIAAPLFWDAASASRGHRIMPHAVNLPEIHGWSRAPAQRGLPWAPRFDRADHRLDADYVNAAGQHITLSIALFAWQDEGKELVGYAQGAADPTTRWSWTNDTPPPPSGKAERIFAPGLAREVVSFYVINGMTTGSPRSVKLATLKSRLFAGDQAAAAILVSAQDWPDRPARPQIDAFLGALGSPQQLAEQLIKSARGR